MIFMGLIGLEKVSFEERGEEGGSKTPCEKPENNYN